MVTQQCIQEHATQSIRSKERIDSPVDEVTVSVDAVTGALHDLLQETIRHV